MKITGKIFTVGMMLCVASMMGACASGGVQMGSQSSKTTATGYTGGSSSAGANAGLERCDRPVGTVSVLENSNSQARSQMRSSGVSSTTPVLRLLAQQSNCFAVVERGRGMSAMKQERELMNSGELRQQSNFGKGQMAAADYTITPNMVFSSNDTGGLGGALGGLIPGRSGRIVGGALAGAKVQFQEAQSVLMLVDNRSGIQVAAAEGSASSKNVSGLLGMIGPGAGGALAGYTKTPEGKLIVGAMTDAFNNMVKAVKSYEAQESAGPGGHGTGGSLEVR